MNETYHEPRHVFVTWGTPHNPKVIRITYKHEAVQYSGACLSRCPGLVFQVTIHVYK